MEQSNYELYHYGRLTQKWGVRNGPPYPLRDNQLTSGYKQNGGVSDSAKAINGGKGSIKKYGARKPSSKLQKMLKKQKKYFNKETLKNVAVSGAKAAIKGIILGPGAAAASISYDLATGKFTGGKKAEEQTFNKLVNESSKYIEKGKSWIENIPESVKSQTIGKVSNQVMDDALEGHAKTAEKLNGKQLKTQKDYIKDGWDVGYDLTKNQVEYTKGDKTVVKKLSKAEMDKAINEMHNEFYKNVGKDNNKYGGFVDNVKSSVKEGVRKFNGNGTKEDFDNDIESGWSPKTGTEKYHSVVRAASFIDDYGGAIGRDYAVGELSKIYDQYRNASKISEKDFANVSYKLISNYEKDRDGAKLVKGVKDAIFDGKIPKGTKEYEPSESERLSLNRQGQKWGPRDLPNELNQRPSAAGDLSRAATKLLDKLDKKRDEKAAEDRILRKSSEITDTVTTAYLEDYSEKYTTSYIKDQLKDYAKETGSKISSSRINQLANQIGKDAYSDKHGIDDELVALGIADALSEIREH